MKRIKNYIQFLKIMKFMQSFNIVLVIILTQWALRSAHEVTDIIMLVTFESTIAITCFIIMGVFDKEIYRLQIKLDRHEKIKQKN